MAKEELRKRSSFVSLAAFLQRAGLRAVGRYKDPVYGQHFEARSARYLSALSLPIDSLRFKIALENLRREWDLLNEDAALLPKPLELQNKMLDLAKSEEIARNLVDGMLNESPLAKLFGAILSSAREDGASKARIDFPSDGKPVKVWFEVGGAWKDTMNVPSSLAEPLRGVAVRASTASYSRVRPFMNSEKPLPDEVVFEWDGDHSLTMTLSTPN